jgi:hypothetical protein
MNERFRSTAGRLRVRVNSRGGPWFDDETIGRPGLATVSRSERRPDPTERRALDGDDGDDGDGASDGAGANSARSNWQPTV